MEVVTPDSDSKFLHLKAYYYSHLKIYAASIMDLYDPYSASDLSPQFSMNA